MRLTYKYRLLPTSAQTTSLNKALDACRWVYNKSLETRKEAWEQRKENLSWYDTVNLIPSWKKDNPFLKDAYSQSLQEACKRVDLAFEAFFRRVKNGEKEKGYPRFRGKDGYDSFTYLQSGFGFIDDEHLRLSKIGDVKIIFHRPIDGEVKTLTIRRDLVGNWYACLSCVVDPAPLHPSPNVVGADLGLTHFATLSTGEHIPNPRFFKHEEKQLAKAQRRLSKCEKGTPEFRKYKRVVQHIHQRIANRRKDFAQKLSKRLVDEFQILAFEDLKIKGMQEDNYRSMNKSIGDAAWRQLISNVSYKAERAGRQHVPVDPKGTTQECSGCGEVVPKDLSVRVHECPHCGLVLDRDINASLNILARGLSSVGFDP